MDILRTEKSRSRLAILAATSLLTSLLTLNLVVHAQTPAQKSYPATKTATGAPMPKAQRKNGGLPASPADFQIDPLKDKVELPNLPEFTGHAKFIMGTMHPTDKGPSYVQHFAAKEDHKLVLDWYKNTLNMYGWKITFADNQVVTAEMKGANCAVSVNDCTGRKDGMNSEIEIDYSQRNKR